MMLVELVPTSLRGTAFGMMGFLEKAAATIATSAVVYYEDWRLPYIAVGSISIAMAFASKRYLKMKTRIKKAAAEELSLVEIYKRISRIPVFFYLVAQGLFGAVPWDMMSFLLLLYEWRGFTKEQMVSFQITSGLLSTIGAFLGGVLGDKFAPHPTGRIGVALTSVSLGILFYGLFLLSETYKYAIVWNSLFYLCGGWTPACALRPICADLAQNQSERAQIVAGWILLEKTSSSVLGAPLVGFITKRLLDKNIFSTNQEKARVLARNLFLLSTFFWGMCIYFFVLMGKAEKYRKMSQRRFIDSHV